MKTNKTEPKPSRFAEDSSGQKVQKTESVPASEYGSGDKAKKAVGVRTVEVNSSTTVNGATRGVNDE